MKTSNLRLSVLALSLATLSSAASAQFYIGGGVGKAQTTGVNGSGLVAAATTATVSDGNNSKNSYKLYGGFQFSPNWGLEAQYSDLGNRTALLVLSGGTVGTAQLSSRAAQLSLAATGTLPLSNNFYLMGKLGASRNIIGSYNGTAGPANVSRGASTKTGLLAGLGVGYNITKNWGARIEYENFGKFASSNGTSGSPVKADNWSISVKYSF